MIKGSDQGVVQAYIGLGGNIGDTVATLWRAIELLAQNPAITSWQSSRFYRTTPVSAIEQPHYVNAVCALTTHLPPKQLLQLLQAVEVQLGKTPKAKEAPRIVDLDLLFYGSERYDDGELTLPHARWQERLFVLRPLRELTAFAPIAEGCGVRWVSIDGILTAFSNPNNETVTLIPQDRNSYTNIWRYQCNAIPFEK